MAAAHNDRRSPRPRQRTRVPAGALQPGPGRGASRPSRRAGRSSLTGVPGGGSLGSPRRSRSNPATSAALLLLLVLATVTVGGWWFYSQPVDITIAAQPADALITVLDSTGTGTLELQDVDAGTYEVTVSREGFETLRTTIAVKRFGETSFPLDLAPLPWALEISMQPSDATCRVLNASGGEAATAQGSLATTLPAGAYSVEVSSAGKNTYTRELFLDRATELEVWLDPEGQVVQSLGIVPCAGAPKGVHVTPDGREAWATILNGPPSIEIFDLETLARVGEVELGEHGAVEITFSRDGTRAYASQMETAKVFEIDTATRTVLRELPTESAWTKVVALSPNGETLYAANWSGDDVSEIDLGSGAVRRRIRTADTPRGLWATPDGTALYVAGFGGGELQRIDLGSGEVTTLFDSNGAMRHMAGDAERGVLFVSDMARDCVWVLDLATGKTTKFVDTDGKPNTIALSPDGRVLFVSCRGANNPKSYYIPGPEWGTILLFDAVTGKPLDAIVGGNQCTALDISGDGRTLVFSDFLDDRLRAYRVPEYDILAAGNGGRWEQHFADLKK